MTSLTYASYLKVEDLLSLQQPQSDGPEHDETLFIIIHQVYELWFKEVLHELDYVQTGFHQNNPARVLQTLKRILTIFKTMTAQIDVLETMTPLEFLSFRGRLDSASGFQSYQFRELEFVLGHKRHSMVTHFPEGSVMRQRLEQRYHQPDLWDAFLYFLSNNGYVVPDELLNRDITQPHEASEQVRTLLVDIYRNNLNLTQVCERLMDMDEGIQEWRYRHVKMVERTIGFKEGTGGSSGVDYLRSTLFKPLFPDLWAI
ncbi:MAG TPA: tryptophan 2,3-dioxygenase family protein, partial [Phototrophicaceae bacterium]|nr:tryptophan 2,3-dioxygenase family protein [Phototrophicaceae bacterium]